MSDLFSVLIDLSRLAARMTSARGKPVTVADADEWLVENGFTKVREHWETEASQLGLLEQAEVLQVWDPNDPDDVPMPGVPTTEIGVPQYFLSDADRDRLREIPDYDLCVIPRFLINSPREVFRAWRQIVRRAVKQGSFGGLIPAGDFVHVDDTPGWFMSRQDRGFSCGSDNVVLFGLANDLADAIWRTAAGNDDETRYVHYTSQMKLLKEGTEHFWFSLVYVAECAWPPDMPPRYARAVRRDCAEILERILRWWPHLCSRGVRFVSSSGRPEPFPLWGGHVFDLLCVGNAWELARPLGCRAAGELARSLLSEFGRREDRNGRLTDTEK